MKIQLAKVVNSVQVFQKLTQQELPVKVSFRLLSLIKQLDEKLKAFEDSRVTLIKKYGENLEDGGFKVKDENLEVFQSDLNELLTEEIELDFVSIDINSLPDSISLSMAELGQIEWVFE